MNKADVFEAVISKSLEQTKADLDNTCQRLDAVDAAVDSELRGLDLKFQEIVKT